MRIINKLSNRFFSGEAIRGISTLASGSTAAQLLVLLASPLLTRLYSPEQFSVLAVFSSVFTIAVVISSLRYQFSIPIADDERAAADLVFLCVLVTACTSLLVGAVAWVFFAAELSSLPSESKQLFILALPLGVFFAGILQIARSWAVRTKNFKQMARARMDQAITTTLFQIAFFSYGAGALLIGVIIGRFCAGYRLWLIFWQDSFGFRTRPSFQRLLSLSYEYRRFPIHSTYGALLSVLGREFPALFMAFTVESTLVGLFALAIRILSTPMSVVSEAVGNVFFSRAARAKDDIELGELAERYNQALSLLAAPALIALCLVSEKLFSLIFGAQWVEAGHFAILLTPFVFGVFACAPLFTIFSIKKKDSELSLYQALMAISRILALVLGFYFGGAYAAILAFSLVSVVVYYFTLNRAFTLIGKTTNRLVRNFFQIMAASIAVNIPLALSVFAAPEKWFFLGVLATTLLILAVYFHYILKITSPISKEV